MQHGAWIHAGWALSFAACGAVGPMSAGPRFADDLAFVRQHSPVVLLQDASGKAQVIVSPEHQGRVLTSSHAPDGPSFGFIKRPVIAAKQRTPHMTVPGGEERLWLGPEGGQFGLYFEPGAPYDLAHWQVPEPLDWGPWLVISQSRSEIHVQKDMDLQNHAGTRCAARVDRSVRVLERDVVARMFEVQLPASVELVGFSSDNVLTNRGETAWTRDTGLLSIWILGMFNPSARTTIVLPFEPGPESELGPIVNDAYFGAVPRDRLVIGESVVYYRGDGEQRGKIGLARRRARPIIGAYDAHAKVLTLIRYTLPAAATEYVNSLWEEQREPYAGDVINSYNDGPPEPGKPPLGPFWELETSSPAAALAPSETSSHTHTTVHLSGSQADLSAIAHATLGVTLAQIAQAFVVAP